MGAEGVSAKPATTVFKVFQQRVEQHGEEPAIMFRDASSVSGSDIVKVRLIEILIDDFFLIC